MKETISSIQTLLRFSENLKCELRHSWLSDGQRESVAEHCWQMALMAIVMYQYLERSVNIEKVLKMIVIHDLVEAETGDIPFFETSRRQTMKSEREQLAIKNIRSMLPEKTGKEVYKLWQEFEANATTEAKFVNALDNLEVQFQHNLADFRTWEDIEYDLVYTKMDSYCRHDKFLSAFCDTVKEDSERKLFDGGIDIDMIKKRTGGW